MVGRVVMKVVVLGLVFCSIAEGRTSSSSRGNDGGDSDGGGDVYVKLNNKQMCLGLNPTTTTTINTTTSTTSNTVGRTTLGTIIPPDTTGLINCQWVIINPKRKNLLLSFTQFDLGAGQCRGDSNKCCYQWLIINPDTPTPGRRRGWWQLGHYHSTLTPQHHHNPHHTTHLPYNGGGSGGDVLGTGRVCGVTLPRPMVTQAPRVFISYYSSLSVGAKSVLAPLAPPSSPNTGVEGRIVENANKGFTLEFYTASNNSMCRDDEFPCYSSHLCVPLTWLCDGKVHCPDHSDEDTCLEEQALHRKQLKKKKKKKKQREEKNENRNKTVESACLQEATTVQCDGAWQCPDGEDEKGCPGCGPDEWWCGMGRQCYSASQRCDGTPHCINSMDELSCNPRCHRRVSCWGWGCYMLSQRCDGSPDCGDASDEADCSPELCNAQHGTFLCNNHRCIRETWRCDQLDDCRDGSDEQDCLRNSVIGVAAMGGLACSLLLVVAVGCTGRLYALRMGLTRMQGSSSRVRGGGSGVRSGGPSGSSHAPRSRLEEHLMQREMPPPYDVAVSDHSTPLFGTCVDWQQWRRQRRRPSVPRDGANTPSRLPADPHHPHFHHHSSPATQVLAVEIQPGGRREGVEEKVEERGGGDENNSSSNAFLFSSMHEQGDVPLLTALVGNEEEGEEGDDVPLLLDITSTTSASTSSSTSSICEGESDQDEEELGSACSRGMGSDGEEEEEEEEDEEEEEEEEGGKGMGKTLTLPLLPDLLHLTPQPLPIPQQPPTTHTEDKTTGESMGMGRKEYTPSSTSPFIPETDINRGKEEENIADHTFPSSSFPLEAGGEGGEGGGGGGGNVLSSDTRAAVLALSAVQTHMNEMSNSDTEMICQ